MFVLDNSHLASNGRPPLHHSAVTVIGDSYMSFFRPSSKYLSALIGLYTVLFMHEVVAEPQITLNDTPVPLFDIYWNMNHGYMTTCGYKHASENVANCLPALPYGAWIDGPMNPYRYGGNTYFQIPHSENFRIKIPNHDWGNRTSWSMEGSFSIGAQIIPAQRDTAESHYNNRNWIFSVYNNSNTLYGLTHHEWYRSNVTVNNISGFNNGSTPWIASIGWINSTDGGTSWSMRPVSEGSSRLVVVPEPSAWNPIQQTFGFMHPSNIVKEGDYYYIFTTTFNYGHSGQLLHGISLFRTVNIATPINWEFWNGSGWTIVNHNTYQGNFGAQMPYVFWGRSDQCSSLYAMNVRQHKGSGKWITLGSKYCLPAPPQGQDFRYQAVFSWANSLANPTNLETNLRDVQQNGRSLLSNNYYSFFDVDGSADDNYQSIGSNPLIVVTDNKNYGTYYHHFLTLTGF
jgi:hypothetical protein